MRGKEETVNLQHDPESNKMVTSIKRSWMWSGDFSYNCNILPLVFLSGCLSLQLSTLVITANSQEL